MTAFRRQFRSLQRFAAIAVTLVLFSTWSGTAPADTEDDPFEMGAPPPEQSAPGQAAPTRQSTPTARRPAPDAGLPAAEKQQIQVALRQLGYYQGAVDGVFGGQTRRAIRDFQRRIGVQQTGYLTADQTIRLHQSAHAQRVAETRPAGNPGCVGPRGRVG